METTKHTEISTAISDVAAGLTRLRNLMQNPDDLSFELLHPHFEHLERALGNKSTIDAAFAFIAERDDAGRRVGSSKAKDYLVARLRNGKNLFAPIEDPGPTPLPEDGKPDAAAQKKAEEEARRRAERERRAEEQRRKKLFEEDPIPERILNLIERELRNLNKFAVPGPRELRNKALEQAKSRSYESLRDWLRQAIRKANRHALDPSGKRDPHAATRKRRFSISHQDADGGVHISGYLDASAAAILASTFAPAKNKGSESLSPKDDTRTYAQRMADQLTAALGSYLSAGQKKSDGLGSFFVATTLEELQAMSSDTRFTTSVGIDLSPLDLLRLGAAQHDFFCAVDDKGFPLELGRTKRTASLWQKLALAANEIVCTHPDCNRPWQDCDVHHLQAWSHGGATDLRNLTLLCRRHHVDNNDNRDGRNGMGHAERDPETGRVGYRSAHTGGLSPLVDLNDSPAAGQAPARKLTGRFAQPHAPVDSPPGSPGDSPANSQQVAAQDSPPTPTEPPESSGPPAQPPRHPRPTPPPRDAA